ncbi:sarcosine oxidase subunit delta family protein [Streptomyces tsukubensis]|uniref:Sarcosine oxidase subunit delta n=1 Tax=Streptomyces tsukubensis TaxID=83656 RepID=A0A1V4A2G0_9ACTN|nr:sarcosine oxidase subunit delta [Streptomyces tsukubensis]OON72734.1 sarcosine oxidase subunit delta [Streptomyces tsukubensis]QFR96829.1 sarcosine oxidase subunit delta family protein [Streptomyces tsukubensis]
MQLIPCPWCGDREEAEFHYGGQADVPYPADPPSLSDAEWAEFVFFRDNPEGPFQERWVHTAGCRRWFNAVRDTSTHTLLSVHRVGERPPDGAARPDARGPAEETTP